MEKKISYICMSLLPSQIDDKSLEFARFYLSIGGGPLQWSSSQHNTKLQKYNHILLYFYTHNYQKSCYQHLDPQTFLQIPTHNSLFLLPCCLHSCIGPTIIGIILYNNYWNNVNSIDIFAIASFGRSGFTQSKELRRVGLLLQPVIIIIMHYHKIK